ncbi:lysophospholipid acyltransferase family protein [Sphingosinicella sp. LHD-64]|uniref:lysophospholipid acyltransferase family protein n=1 Tax=Sphingosinicella sp. LHD-64 TaxID=3072139 RepID=UPI00280D4AB8|nr:lysophospholipid acyltransferase family protein [Sphingosinicella sp. LHD-64]MDQ8758306.1 lysophospholipid acyltransferase family protein [Sphingosinicella sp. LHD-64]
MRLTLRVAGLVAGLIFCVPLHYLWKLLGLGSIWPQLFLAWAGRCAGLDVRIEGVPLRGRVLFAANHLSWLDIVALGSAVPASFVAKDEVEGWPVIGWLAGLNQTIHVAREARRAARGQADQLRAALTRGRAVALFPEGTTDGGTGILPFRASLFASLYPPIEGVRVQPVAIDYGPLADEIAWIGEESTGENAKRIFSRKGRIPVTLHFLAPVDPAAAADRKALAARAEAGVVEALGASARAVRPV